MKGPILNYGDGILVKGTDVCGIKGKYTVLELESAKSLESRIVELETLVDVLMKKVEDSQNLRRGNNMETITINYTKFLEALTAGNGRAELNLDGKTYIVFTEQALKECKKERK